MSLRIEVSHGLQVCVEISVVRVDFMDDTAVAPAASLHNGHLFATEMISEAGEAMPKPVDSNRRQINLITDAVNLIIQALFD